MTNSMGPPPPKNPNLPSQTLTSSPPPNPDSHSSQSTTNDSSQPEQPPPPPPPPFDSTDTQTPKPSQGIAVPYKIPLWNAAPCHEFYLEVLKDGSIIDKFNVSVSHYFIFLNFLFYLIIFFNWNCFCLFLIWIIGMRKVLICLGDWISVILCLNIQLFLGFMLVCICYELSLILDLSLIYSYDWYENVFSLIY